MLRSLPTLLLSTFALVACTPPPGADGDDKGSKAGKDGKDEGENASEGEDAKGAKGEKKEVVTRPEGDCCRYCVEGVPCGDECIDEGATCEGKEEGCACKGEDRPPTKFKKGQVIRSGIIKADVPAYNKVQGDPVEGFFTLEKAFEGDEALANKEGGQLTATFKTSMGDFECELFENEAPLTVANFVGLARGTRPFRNKEKKWVNEPFYDGVIFHRVIDGFMLQTGDRTGTGSGNPGFLVPDEFDPNLRHSGPGILSMANRNRPDERTKKLRVDPKTGQTIGNTGSSQFFVTVAKTPHLDDRHAIFGKCDKKVPIAISKVPVKNQPRHGIDHRPVEQVTLEKIEISRKAK